jgi:hypothetical protein
MAEAMPAVGAMRAVAGGVTLALGRAVPGTCAMDSVGGCVPETAGRVGPGFRAADATANTRKTAAQVSKKGRTDRHTLRRPVPMADKVRIRAASFARRQSRPAALAYGLTT